MDFCCRQISYVFMLCYAEHVGLGLEPEMEAGSSEDGGSRFSVEGVFTYSCFGSVKDVRGDRENIHGVVRGKVGGGGIGATSVLGQL